MWFCWSYPLHLVQYLALYSTATTITIYSVMRCYPFQTIYVTTSPGTFQNHCVHHATCPLDSGTMTPLHLPLQKKKKAQPLHSGTPGPSQYDSTSHWHLIMLLCYIPAYLIQEFSLVFSPKLISVFHLRKFTHSLRQNLGLF